MPNRPLLRAYLTAFIVLLALGMHARAQAAPIPWSKRDLAITARDQNLRDYLQDFFAQQGLAVQLSDGVRGQVSGSFSPANFDRLLNGFGLLPYFDGGIVHIYSNAEAVSRTLTVDPALVRNVVRTMALLEMPDRRNTFKALEREGVIVVSGGRRFVEQVEEVVRGVLSQSIAGPSRFRVFPLKHAWSWDVSFAYGGKQYVIPGVASLLRSLIAASPQRLERGEQQRRPTQERLRGRGLGAVGADARPNAAGRDDVTVAEAFVADNATAGGGSGRVESDRRMNAVIVRDTNDRMPFYEELIRILDVEPQVIEIEATIIDVNADRLLDLGVNWRWTNGRNSTLFGRGDESDLRLRPGAPQDITPAGRGLFFSTILGDRNQFIARINALAADGDAKVISRPRVLTMSNLEANIENTKTFFVRVQGFQEVDLFNVVSGTSLRVTPSVVIDNGKPRVRLLINIADGKITGESVDQIPIVDDTRLNTQATVGENESVLVGGLVREETQTTRDKVPLLGDLPLLGYLFSNTSKRTLRTERMFLITPRVMPASRVGELNDRPSTPAAPAPVPAPGDPARPAQPPAGGMADDRVGA